jgi:fucose permease
MPYSPIHENFDVWVSIIFLVMAIFGGKGIPGITAVVIHFATKLQVFGNYQIFLEFSLVCMIYFLTGLANKLSSHSVPGSVVSPGEQIYP